MISIRVTWWHRLVCFVLGHRGFEPTAGVTLCERCDAVDDYYGSGTQWTDRERYGLFEPLRAVWRWLLEPWPWPRCQHCGRVLLSRKQRYHGFCSKQCLDAWLPF